MVAPTIVIEFYRQMQIQFILAIFATTTNALLFGNGGGLPKCRIRDSCDGLLRKAMKLAGQLYLDGAREHGQTCVTFLKRKQCDGASYYESLY